MKYYIVIPAYNEGAFIALALQSIAAQTIIPDKVVVVDDSSSDNTADIVRNYMLQYSWLTLVNKASDQVHLPGSKVIRAFTAGYNTLDEDYDIIVKLDADLILPPDYFQTIITIFKADPKVGMAGGFAYIENNGQWLLENLTDKDHIRGAFKAYRKECFIQIGKLQPAMGWDTVDELLAKYYGWKVVTNSALKVKHLKPTGASYNKAARYKQGEAFYSLGYGLLITAIASAKLSLRKKKPQLFFDYMSGFFRAKWAGKPLLVSAEQANFIRRYRWQKMKSKIK